MTVNAAEKAHMAALGNSTIAEDVAASDVLIQVQNAFSGDEVASVKIPLTSSVFDLQLRLEEPTAVPAEHQILLREGDVLPLRRTATLLDEGLEHDSRVFFTNRNQAPKHADLELFEVCQGCRCGFREEGFGGCQELAKKSCDCERLPDRGPRMTQVQYLLRYIPDDVPFLQSVFERLVLAGGPRCYTLAAAYLAQDTRINVNAVGCSCTAFSSLFEDALLFNHVDMLLMLMDTGRLEPNFQHMSYRLTLEFEHRFENRFENVDGLLWKVVGAPFGSVDRESLISHLVDNLDASTKKVRQFIIQQKRQHHPFFKNLTVTHRKAIEDVYKDFLDCIMEARGTKPMMDEGVNVKHCRKPGGGVDTRGEKNAGSLSDKDVRGRRW
eukprot:CAMPEP_0172668400 /NCGR_PEP_ID=MMETSP1074-20121228/9034_1 /TAXON_ID=2916 /ORGANISM="Ceratium fusus, Strain PA161109" /LENGTH=381 /DNA_ID=CAMNT_0013485043 /DNA_START=14 /DNA_END=1157 /DNA_ORIENTATION=+